MQVVYLRLPTHRRGATIVLIALLNVILAGMVAFAVDVGRMYLARAQLQTAVDAGALAAGLQLRDDPDDVEAAIAAGEQFVQYNRVGTFVTVPAESITIQAGSWNEQTRTFLAGAAEPDAIEVNASVDHEPFFFGRLLGLDEFAVPRGAIAQGGGSPLDIAMTLDLSGSMASQGRIEALRDAAPTFVDVIEEVGDNDRIAVFGYGALPEKYDPAARGHSGVEYLIAPGSLYPADSDWVAVKEADLTDNFDYLRSSVLNSSTLIANKYNGWTPVGAALRDSAHYLKANARDDVDKVIVLMSDGHANKPDRNGPGYAIDMAAYAAGLNIKVYTISLGNGADEDMMQRIADTTGAEHFIASGTGSSLSSKLTQAFQHVANAIKKSQLVQ